MITIVISTCLWIPMTITVTTTNTSNSFTVRTHNSMMPNWGCIHDVLLCDLDY